ncbi:dienelactone hydrolase family protein [Tsukamurella strandjordii]|uniref:Dienelactone hydrolase family protein n=1 Tax=Tsukamurella strandjordii TaxID=147577 RepID=A0AA90SL59_9ACTN|nr:MULTISPECIES: dienelactone hydrolase family protein [Tsukamurella]MDP0397898.1 dienelactone hydrolase family protein [Tsukamurella strandjordii]
MADFAVEPFTAHGTTHDVYRKGTGPAVIVMAEIPGITPKVLDFARKLVDAGFTAVLPHLFGVPGLDADPRKVGIKGTATAVASVAPLCVSKEFTILAVGKSSPVITWLRALARQEHERCGGKGVGAVGMCFTGGFALGMAVDDVLLAPVLSQPSLPLGITPSRRHNIDISPEDLETVKVRCAKQGLKVLGMRFTGDKMVPGERFAFLREQLGDAFIAVEIDDADANPDAPTPPHSVLTEHLIDEPGQPTRAALDQVIDLMRSTLR